MTSKEAIIIDKLYKTYQISDDVYKQIMSVAQYERKIEDVLDKIRAEIEQRKKNSGGEPNRELAFNVCLQIFDKYRNEVSE